MNRKMAQQYNSTDSEWEIDEEGIGWFWELYRTILYDTFTSRTFQELGYYIGLTAVLLVGFGVLHHYNVQHELRLLDLAEEEERKNEENKNKDKKDEEKENKSKTNFKHKTD